MLDFYQYLFILKHVFRKINSRFFQFYQNTSDNVIRVCMLG